MTADVVNLRRVRKAKAHLQQEKSAAANRAAFGRSKAERTRDKAAGDRAARALDGHRREPDRGE
jgi:hypothetical protein